MAKVDLSQLQDALKDDGSDDQKKVEALAKKTGTPKLVPQAAKEPMVQVNICNVPKSVKRAIEDAARDQDLTLRSFILKAIREQGIAVPEEILADRRKG